MRGTSLLAQPFDPSSGRLSGEAASVAEGVQFDLSTWHGVFSVSDGPVLVYQPGGLGSGNLLVWYDRAGKVLGSLGERANYFGPPCISPDGKRVAAQIGDPGDMYIFDVVSGLKTRLTFTPSSQFVGAWSPDGSQIAFSSIRKIGRYGIYVKPSNGSSPEQVLLVSAHEGYFVSDWSRDGRFLLFFKNVVGQQRHGWLLPLAGDRKPRELLAEHDGDEVEAEFSPDSRWVAYQVSTSGPMTIFVAPVQGSGAKWQVSTAGGYSPRWRGDGKELYYLAPDLTLMAAEVDGTGSDFRVGRVVPLFQTHALSNPNYGYDVSRDGNRFLVSSVEGAGGAPLTLVLNWNEGLKK
jgi:Tol biopolymer transport system component